MLAAESPLSGHQLIQAPKTSRRPLQPKNALTTTTINSNNIVKPKPNPGNWFYFDISRLDYNSNKENVPPIYSTPVKKSDPLTIDSFDSTLADELRATREKLERLKTENLLKERTLMLDLHIKEIVDRGEAQKQLEIEVDRLYRLKEIKLACIRVSPIRSLRDKEQEKKMKQEQLKALIRIKDRDEGNNESSLQTPISEPISP